MAIVTQSARRAPAYRQSPPGTAFDVFVAQICDTRPAGIALTLNACGYLCRVADWTKIALSVKLDCKLAISDTLNLSANAAPVKRMLSRRKPKSKKRRGSSWLERLPRSNYFISRHLFFNLQKLHYKISSPEQLGSSR